MSKFSMVGFILIGLLDAFALGIDWLLPRVRPGLFLALSILTALITATVAVLVWGAM